MGDNGTFAESFDQGDLPIPPAKHVAIGACMDARLHPEKFLGLDIGDAHCIRNAGGRASDDAIRSLIISSHLLGNKEFAVIHHTDCGMLTFTNDTMVEKLGEEAGAIDFLTFSDNEASVREDVDRIRQHPLIPDDIPVSGYIYDVTSGRLEEVVSAGS
ncbi:MAG: beta-class carbonic anhydrase [Acidimicrobiales bacterium]|nr:carbonic anhydrase [Actinomycetota bacterium]